MIRSRFEEARHVEAVRQMQGRRVEVPIEGGYGTVMAGGYGELIEVKIDRRVVRYTDPSRLAPRILLAIQSAQQKANAEQ